MRILHVTPLYHPFVGGAESYTRELSERLVRRGHDVTVLTMNAPLPHGGRSAPVEVLNGVRIRRFSPAGRLHAACAAVLRTRLARWACAASCSEDPVELWARSPYGVVPAAQAIRDRPQVVSVINWYGGWLPLQVHLARRLRRFAVVGVPLFHTECRWPHAPVFAKLLQHCDAAVAMTEHERTFMAAAGDRAHAIGVGVEPAAFARADGRAVRQRYSIGDAPLVGYIGRMDASKGIDVLVRAMRSVWQRMPEARLLLAGAGATSADGRPDVPSPAMAMLADDERARIVVTGAFEADQKPSLFDALDVFAMPSLAESFGIAYLEAWMRRKPVVGTRLGSTGFVVDDGANGCLVPPGDADELARALLRLLEDRTTRQQFGERGYSKAVTRFAWDAVVDAIERVYLDAYARTFPHAVPLSAGAPAPVRARRESA